MTPITVREQTILIDPSYTPTGLGVAQWDYAIYPISPCHKQSYQKDGHSQARCNASGCRKVAANLNAFATQCASASDPESIEFFVKHWTGLTSEDMKISVGSTA